MSKERITELKELLVNLEKRMRPLEWDASRNQINEYRKQQLGQLKGELENLKQELTTLETPPEQ